MHTLSKDGFFGKKLVIQKTGGINKGASKSVHVQRGGGILGYSCMNARCIQKGRTSRRFAGHCGGAGRAAERRPSSAAVLIVSEQLRAQGLQVNLLSPPY